MNEQKSLINQINFLAMQQYLTGHNWDKIISKKSDKAFFRKPLEQNNMIEVLVPLSRDFIDYEYAMQKAINLIADFEKREPIQIINDLLLPPADQIRFRVNNSRTKDGLISLSEGSMLFESAKKALLTTAHDILKPETYHKRLGLKNAQQFIDSCLMGQTERGSFIASVVCPIGNNSSDDTYQQLSLFDPIELLTSSFTRQVTSRLMDSINKVKHIVESQAYDKLENPQIDKISANFLESLIEMGEYGDNEEIQILCSWAPTVPQQNPDIPNSVTITRDYIRPLESIVERIRERAADEIGEFVGRISEIKADPDIHSRNDGQIAFNCIGDIGAIKAKAILNNDDFQKAVQAFETGKNIKVTGVLKSSGRTKIIENPSFEVID